MKLTEEQKTKVAAWIESGAKLDDVQKRLEKEFGLRLTYLETRLLIGDLQLVPKNIERAKPKEISKEPVVAPPAAAAPALKVGEAVAPAAGNVSVTVDQLTRPGALVSGGVKFSDGQAATWYLDETGRLGLVPAVPGYKPTPEDVKAFQLALQAEMQKLGY